jgi:hypothetical protein
MSRGATTGRCCLSVFTTRADRGSVSSQPGVSWPHETHFRKMRSFSNCRRLSWPCNPQNACLSQPKARAPRPSEHSVNARSLDGSEPWVNVLSWRWLLRMSLLPVPARRFWLGWPLRTAVLGRRLYKSRAGQCLRFVNGCTQDVCGEGKSAGRPGWCSVEQQCCPCSGRNNAQREGMRKTPSDLVRRMPHIGE